MVAAIKEDAKNLKCKGHDVNVAEEDMEIIVECAMELGITSKEQMTKEKMPVRHLESLNLVLRFI